MQFGSSKLMCHHKCINVLCLLLMLSLLLWPKCILVILAWNEIGRSAIFGREIGVPDREVFSWRKKKSILVAKIVISSTVDHCKMFYLPVYGMLNNIVHCSAPFWWLWEGEWMNEWMDRWMAREWVSKWAKQWKWVLNYLPVFCVCFFAVFIL